MTDDAEATPSAEHTTPVPLPATLLLGLALFVPQVVAGLYRGTERDLPEAMPVLGAFLLWTALVTWFTFYCRSNRISVPMDMGLFLLWAWPLVVPYYVLKREGRRGFARIGLFCLSYGASWAAGTALAIWGRILLGTE